jgi:hypothetical protein
MAAAVKLSESAKAVVGAGVVLVSSVVAHFAGADSDAMFLVGVGTAFLAGVGIWVTPNAKA